MYLKNFEDSISEVVLKRGKNYYEEGAVTDLQGMDNGQWFAIVEGNDDYEVDIRLGKNDAILKYVWNCPFEGDICKHVVAVLYRIREEKAEKLPEKRSTGQSNWKNLIGTVPENDLRDFLTEYAVKNKDFRNKLLLHFSEYDDTINREKYRKIIQGIFSAAGGRNGYIDYHHVSGTISQVYDLLAKADEYLDKNIYTEAFYIAAAVATECVSTFEYIDDSDGDCGGAINDSFEIISKILSSDTESALKKEIFDWLLREAGNPDYDDYGCSSELYPLLVEAADSPERTGQVLDFFDDQLKKAGLEEGWSKEYRSRNFLKLKMDTLLKSGQEEKADDIISDNMHIHDFRKIIVEKNLAEHKFDEAIRLIREGIDIAEKDNYAGVVTDWKEMLTVIYKKQNNVKELRIILKDLYYSGRYEINYYRDYKSTFGKEEWNSELEKIINAHKKNEKGGNSLFRALPGHLAAVYIEEKMWGELFGLLQRFANIHELLHYTHYLEKEYAPELIRMYNNAILQEAERASTRNAYHEIASFIKKMSELPGGKEPAGLLINQLMVQFAKRPAMKDELGKID